MTWITLHKLLSVFADGRFDNVYSSSNARVNESGGDT